MTVYLSLVFILLITFIASLVESASIQSAKNYYRADINRAVECVFAEYQKELLEVYDVFALDAGYETGDYTEENVRNRIQYYAPGNMDHEIKRVQFLTDDGCGAFLEQVAQYMEHKYGIDIVKDKLGMTSIWGEQEEKSKEYAEGEQNEMENLEELLEENEGELPAEENPIQHVETLKQSSILNLVLPKDRAVSEKTVDPGKMLSQRKKNRGFGEFSNITDVDSASMLLFGEYLLEHFTKFTDEEKKGTLDYELEYIIAGENSDQKNLESVVKKLMLIRFVPNYAYIQTDSSMKAQADAMALTLCSFLAVPAVTETAAQVILLAWAYGESIMDLRSLLKGNRVAVVKSKDSWQLSLASLLKLGTAEESDEGMDTEGGLDYAEYLRMLLFLEKKEEAAERTLGMIEQNVRSVHGITNFQADLCISRMEIKTVCKLRRGITYDFLTYYDYQ